MSQIVFITGASSGIGQALARQYAARGATLGLVARRVDALHGFVQTLPAGIAVHCYAATCAMPGRCTTPPRHSWPWPACPTW